VQWRWLLDAAPRQLLKRHVILLAQGTQFRARKMAVPARICHHASSEILLVRSLRAKFVNSTL
jgi:hypothetical protein